MADSPRSMDGSAGDADYASSRKSKALLIGLVSLFSLLVVTVSIGLANTRSDPILRSLDLKVPDFGPDVMPIRVALLSDIHLGNRAMDVTRLTRIVASVNAARPDLVLIAGDFLNGHDASSASRQASELSGPLAQLHAPLGVIAVLGNHDHWVAPERVRDALIKAGIVVLENEAVRRGPLAIVGIGDRFSGHDDIARATEGARLIGGTPLVLTHSPDVVPDLPSNITMVLAGHTHCGQVVLPGYGSLSAWSIRERFRRLYLPHYMCGVVREAGRITIVTGGLGSGTIPIRLGAMPDWWLITLS